MALLYGRIKQSRLNDFSLQFKRFYFQIRPSSFANHQGSKGVTDYCCNHIIKLQHASNYPRQSDLLPSSVRFFAAPVQFQNQKKVEVEEPKGHRLNEKIKAEFVRLVSDEGHTVLSRHEALQRAKSLKLDLVEVDRHAKPPVCKIMDYKREKYLKEVKEKERSKIKAKGTLRTGDCKEVRLTLKTELKDRKMKADMITRLMERGYRVKCMAMGKEDQDLAGLLSQILDMIEDVAFVETGPKVEKKQAYFVVRHVKFGPPKRGGKKASNSDGATSAETYQASDNDEATSAEDFDKVFNYNHDVLGNDTCADMQFKVDARITSPAANNKAVDFSEARTSVQEPENRYARNTKNNAPCRIPFVGPSVQESQNRYVRNMKNNTPNRQFEPRSNFSAPGGRFGPAGGHSSQSTGFGIFSAPETDASEKHGSGAEVNQHSNANPFAGRSSGPGNPGTTKPGSSQGSGADDSGKYGVFSINNSNSTPGRS